VNWIPRIKYSLRWWLLGVVLLGTAIGLGVRAKLAADIWYETKTGAIERFAATATWRKNALGEETLVYLVIFAKGDLRMHSNGNGISRNPIEARPGSQGFGVYPKSLYCDDNRVPGSADGWIWVYSPFREKPIQVQQHNVLEREFDRFEVSPLWKEKVRAIAEAESAAWEDKRRRELKLEVESSTRARASAQVPARTRQDFLVLPE